MADTAAEPQTEGRSARKRRVILDAATSVFLEHGYVAASMDQVAALASVSKQTVYKHFTDKEALFAEILQGTASRADDLEHVVALALSGSEDVVQDLTQVARGLLTLLAQPEVRQVRRLVIGEAGRFPDLGRAWYEGAFLRGMAALTGCFEELSRQGHLTVDDPKMAANHFAGLVLWAPVNRFMLCGDDEVITPEEIDEFATAGVRTFLAAFGVHGYEGPAGVPAASG